MLGGRTAVEGLEGLAGSVIAGVHADAVAVELMPHWAEDRAEHQADVPLVQVLDHLGEGRGRGVVDVADGGEVEDQPSQRGAVAELGGG